jgi:nuclear pore complex protein Nup160
MPTSYLPQRLIHAHLPSSSTTRDEAQIPVITEREFPTTDETEEPLSPDHATSTILEHTTGILARVTHNGYLLNLSNFALTSPSHSSLSRSTIKIAFPDRLRPLREGCIIPYPEDGRVYILVVTESDVVYRLKLSMSMGEDGVKMTNKGMDDWCEEWEVPEETLVACGGVGAWRVIDEDTIVLGGADGGIVRLTRAGKWGRGMFSLSW